MFGISFPELFIIIAVALVVFGPDKLPEIARKLGKLTADLRRNSDSLRREFYNTVYKPSDEPARDFKLIGKELSEIARDITALPTSTEAPSAEDAQSIKNSDSAPPPQATPLEKKEVL
jgi:TatA/E family protein of Tat protein translocase